MRFHALLDEVVDVDERFQKRFDAHIDETHVDGLDGRLEMRFQRLCLVVAGSN